MAAPTPMSQQLVLASDDKIFELRETEEKKHSELIEGKTYVAKLPGRAQPVLIRKRPQQRKGSVPGVSSGPARRSSSQMPPAQFDGNGARRFSTYQVLRSPSVSQGFGPPQGTQTNSQSVSIDSNGHLIVGGMAFAPVPGQDYMPQNTHMVGQMSKSQGAANTNVSRLRPSFSLKLRLHILTKSVWFIVVECVADGVHLDIIPGIRLQQGRDQARAHAEGVVALIPLMRILTTKTTIGGVEAEARAAQILRGLLEEERNMPMTPPPRAIEVTIEDEKQIIDDVMTIVGGDPDDPDPDPDPTALLFEIRVQTDRNVLHQTPMTVGSRTMMTGKIMREDDTGKTMLKRRGGHLTTLMLDHADHHNTELDLSADLLNIRLDKGLPNALHSGT